MSETFLQKLEQVIDKHARSRTTSMGDLLGDLGVLIEAEQDAAPKPPTGDGTLVAKVPCERCRGTGRLDGYPDGPNGRVVTIDHADCQGTGTIERTWTAVEAVGVMWDAHCARLEHEQAQCEGDENQRRIKQRAYEDASAKAAPLVQAYIAKSNARESGAQGGKGNPASKGHGDGEREAR